MKNILQKKRQEGFTIIEVLIVLAIAGLIILIVFLAVPALQRNSRNTQRKNDVSAIVGAMQEYINNNNGQLPKDDAEEAKALGNAKLSFYDVTADIDINTQITTAAAVPVQTNKLVIRNFAKCDAANDALGAGSSKRNIVAVYEVETSGVPQKQCQDS